MSGMSQSWRLLDAVESGDLELLAQETDKDSESMATSKEAPDTGDGDLSLMPVEIRAISEQQQQPNNASTGLESEEGIVLPSSVIDESPHLLEMDQLFHAAHEIDDEEFIFFDEMSLMIPDDNLLELGEITPVIPPRNPAVERHSSATTITTEYLIGIGVIGK
jgi:hypothetical protein